MGEQFSPIASRSGCDATLGYRPTVLSDPWDSYDEPRTLTGGGVKGHYVTRFGLAEGIGIFILNVETKGNSRSVAVVTGASAGLGGVFAQRLAGQGCDLILVARRENRLRTLAAELEGRYGVAAEILVADLTDDADRRAVAERIRECERLEYLINNAGFGTQPLFAGASLASQDAMARLHVLAVMHLTHAALEGLIRRGRGYLVNVSSVAGFFAGPSNVMYCSTKAWMTNFTQGLAIELAGTGVTVQALCPGFTYTEFHDVSGMDRRSVPRKWWLDAGFVVDCSLRALRRGRPVVVIPGIRYKIVSAILQALPRRLRNYLAGIRYRRMEKYNQSPAGPEQETRRPSR
jgi:short-subunit dehydrogenase